MNARQERALGFDELVKLENQSEVRHEFIGGQLYAMAGGSVRHAHIITNVTTAVHGRSRGRSCRGASGDQRVRTSDKATNWFYLDFLIMCPPYRLHPRDKTAP